tara:strand:- start:195 stop:401 length:207 start_codon:yes stop_codon:yes gene_type:complete
MNSNERFEYMAELFYKDTGLMAPGKDSPVACGITNREQRDEAWNEWIEKFYSKLFALHESNANCCENN